MSQITLNFHRSDFYPPREGIYYVWAGGIPKIAKWDNRRWFALDERNVASQSALTNVTYWAVVPQKADLERADAPFAGENDANEKETEDARQQ